MLLAAVGSAVLAAALAGPGAVMEEKREAPGALADGTARLPGAASVLARGKGFEVGGAIVPGAPVAMVDLGVGLHSGIEVVPGDELVQADADHAFAEAEADVHIALVEEAGESTLPAPEVRWGFDRWFC